jgi:hypothetical protein
VHSLPGGQPVDGGQYLIDGLAEVVIVPREDVVQAGEVVRHDRSVGIPADDGTIVLPVATRGRELVRARRRVEGVGTHHEREHVRAVDAFLNLDPPLDGRRDVVLVAPDVLPVLFQRRDKPADELLVPA